MVSRALRQVSRAWSAVTPDIEYAAAYAVRMHAYGDQQIRSG
jgi:hypothetical protein